MYAIIKSGGKQYKISPGEILKVEALDIEKGKNITFDEVLMLCNKNKIEIGKPLLKNVAVVAKVLENKKDKKVLIFKKRRRHNSRRLNGHRQSISVVQINNISLNGKPLVVDKKEVTKTVKEKKDTKVNKLTKDKKDGA